MVSKLFSWVVLIHEVANIGMRIADLVYIFRSNSLYGLTGYSWDEAAWYNALWRVLSPEFIAPIWSPMQDLGWLLDSLCLNVSSMKFPWSPPMSRQLWGITTSIFGNGFCVASLPMKFVADFPYKDNPPSFLTVQHSSTYPTNPTQVPHFQPNIQPTIIQNAIQASHHSLPCRSHSRSSFRREVWEENQRRLLCAGPRNLDLLRPEARASVLFQPW